MLDSVLLGLRVALSLALVLVILWFIARKVNQGGAATRRVPITVLGRQSLGRRSGLAVVEVAGRTLVVGVSETGVQLLTELDGDAAAGGVSAADLGGSRASRTADLAASLGGAPVAGGQVIAGRFSPAADDRAARGAGVYSTADAADDGDVQAERPAFRPVGAERRRRSFEQVLATETDIVPRHRARRRAPAPQLTTGPLSGSVLDKTTWTRTWAAIQERSAR
ncbi:FliO/MopB family protein [Georgenia yuyongxinii]|uniref:FliO/MopB family protein n=1 Tax=Georgenia yuyongxinii TaxID=2589797 RepID=A0A5B8BZB1_9MICO|nr:flagellar biosynthetic protein FliO [Georgenia yuyongxinii]QDC23654.1 FliO/MopB family protein [Georgenia yuyongxinii]